ncbi:MAG TPA: dihydropteroate synthase [Phycisphaerae bacterium]|nr:dihydropteroate synthase [Phycisphaerae bacterium]
MLHLRLNARVIATANTRPVLDEMGRAGTPPAESFLARTDMVAVALENVAGPEAQVLKRAMLEAGGDASASPRPSDYGADTCNVVLIGSRNQFRALLDRLAGAPAAAAAIGQEVRRALDAHGRTHFTIRMGSRRLAVGPQPAVMGIVNVTPDSFSDGGLCLESHSAVAHAQRLVAEGADIIDVGGESTRPGSDPVPEDEELARVLPVVETLASRVDVAISIDTCHARVAREAVAAGACLVNDVTGLRGDPDMAAVVAETGAGVAIMHMLGHPKTMQDHPHYDHLMADICRYLRHGMQAAVDAGVPEDSILVDPGIGFGKTVDHNLEILARLGQLRTLGVPILVGPSRKRFIGEVAGVEAPSERTYGTAAACCLAQAAGALVLRVHDVREVRQALTVAAAIAQVDENAS